MATRKENTVRNAYERILNVMREQGSKDNPEQLQLARVVGGQVVIGGQRLDPEDYLIADGVTIADGDTVLIIQISDDQYVVICKVVSA